MDIKKIYMRSELTKRSTIGHVAFWNGLFAYDTPVCGRKVFAFLTGI